MLSRDVRFFRVLCACAVAVAISGCSDARKPEVSAAAAAPISSPVAPPRAGTDAVTDYIASGPIVVENQVDMLSQRDGGIAEVKADLGTAVKKGEVLATMDDRQLTAERDAQQAKVRSIEADLKNWQALTDVAATERDRAEQMWKAQLITQQERERAGYKAQAARFEV